MTWLDIYQKRVQHHGMVLSTRAILRDTAFALVAGVVLWPPVSELLYWSVFESIGDAVVLLVLAASVAVGAGFCAVTTVSPRSFAVGGTTAYLVGMGLIQGVLTPDSPVHFLLYGVILVGMETGVIVVAVAEREAEASTTGETTPEG